MMFTGKYGNINFRMKIAYYPTLPREHHTKHDSQHLHGGGSCMSHQRLMTQGPTQRSFTHLWHTR